MTVGRQRPTGEPAQAEVVASDLEGTLTSAETWRALVRRLRAEGREWPYRGFVLRRLPRIAGVRLGLLDRQSFRDNWLTDLAGLLRGMGVAWLDRLAEEIVAQDLWPARNQPAVAELQAHIAAGRTILLCSGTYQPVLDAFCRRLGTTEALGTALEEAGGILTGRLVEPPNTGSRKATRLRAALGDRTLLAAYGDSLADAEMLEASTEAVVVQPEPALRRLAESRGWRVLEAG